jgi:NADH-quinone oxidoreductase subunit N
MSKAFVFPDFYIAQPELILLGLACAVMLFDLYVRDARRSLTYALAQVALLGSALSVLNVLTGTMGDLAYTFNGLYVADVMGHILKLFACVTLSVVLIYSRTYLADRGLLKGEFLSLLLFALLGMFILISANSFLTIYLGLELLSLSLYAMVALNRDSALSTEAAMKYFVLGALASGLLLYGMSMIYGATGSLMLTEISRALSQGAADRTVVVFGLVFLVSGLAFKLGVVPFHMWIPDVYHGAPTAVTLVIGSAPKLAAFAMAMRLLVNGLLELAVDWQQMLIILAVLSMAIGNIAAIAQTNLKRMFAYSTISHMGFMLLGLLTGVVQGNWLNAADAYSAAMFYAIVYVLMSLGAFGTLLYLSRAGFECEHLDDLRGLNRKSPWTAFIAMLLMFSMAGVPPTAGFYAKFLVLSSTVAAGQLWLAVLAVIFSLIGAFYYLRIVKLMYFDEPLSGRDVAVSISGNSDMRLMYSVNGLALLALGLLPQPLMALCFIAIIKSL